MPASVLPDEEVWRRADRFDSAMWEALRRVRDRTDSKLPRAAGVTRSEDDALTRLTSVGMVDAGHEGTSLIPHLWALNANGERALKLLDTPSTADENEEPRAENG